MNYEIIILSSDDTNVPTLPIYLHLPTLNGVHPNIVKVINT